MRDETTETAVNEALAQTITHTVGYAILRVLGERVASAKELATALSQPRSTVGDQLRKLHANGLIEIVREKMRRGTAERFYGVTPSARWLTDAETSQLASEEKKRITLRIVREALVDTSAALATDALDRRDDWCVGVTRLTVDLRGWKELAAIHRQAVEEVERVRAESAKRLAGADSESLRAFSWVTLLERPTISD